MLKFVPAPRSEDEVVRLHFLQVPDDLVLLARGEVRDSRDFRIAGDEEEVLVIGFDDEFLKGDIGPAQKGTEAAFLRPYPHDQMQVRASEIEVREENLFPHLTEGDR